MQLLTNVRSERDAVGYAVGGRHGIGHRHGWNPIRDNPDMNTEAMPVRGSVRIGTHYRAEAAHAATPDRSALGGFDDGENDVSAADWPPLEQDDTSDDLHESPWWKTSSDPDVSHP
jgi:hypothetical protein